MEMDFPRSQTACVNHKWSAVGKEVYALEVLRRPKHKGGERRGIHILVQVDGGHSGEATKGAEVFTRQLFISNIVWGHSQTNLHKAYLCGRNNI